MQNNIANSKELELDIPYHIKIIQDNNEFDKLIHKYWINEELIFSVENKARRNWTDVHLFLNYEDKENTNIRISNFILTRAAGEVQMKTEKCLFMRYLITAIWRLFFHPAKFDNFKVEKMSDYTTV